MAVFLKNCKQTAEKYKHIFENWKFQMAVTLKVSIFVSMLLKSKCVWEVAVFLKNCKQTAENCKQTAENRK